MSTSCKDYEGKSIINMHRSLFSFFYFIKYFWNKKFLQKITTHFTKIKEKIVSNKFRLAPCPSNLVERMEMWSVGVKLYAFLKGVMIIGVPHANRGAKADWLPKYLSFPSFVTSLCKGRNQTVKIYTALLSTRFIFSYNL